MCLLIGDNLAFSAPPKTGTTFVADHARRNGVRVDSYATGVHAVDSLWGMFGGGDRGTFTIIRHPFAWLTSVFFHLRKRESRGGCRLPSSLALFNSAPFDDFDRYIQWVVCRPNLTFYVFEPYASCSDFVLRNETLREDLDDLLEHHGYETGRSAGRVNVTSRDCECELTSSMRDDIRATQPYLFDVYGYDMVGVV